MELNKEIGKEAGNNLEQAEQVRNEVLAADAHKMVAAEIICQMPTIDGLLSDEGIEDLKPLDEQYVEATNRGWFSKVTGMAKITAYLVAISLLALMLTKMESVLIVYAKNAMVVLRHSW